MSDMEIWHNPRCSKSRQTLRLLEERGVTPVVRNYLDVPPGAERIAEVLQMLSISPRELMRNKEAPYRQLGLDDDGKSDAELIRAMAEHPVLIERPVIIRGDRAVVGRPPENVLELL